MRLCRKIFFLYLFPEVALERGGKGEFCSTGKKIFITKREDEVFRESFQIFLNGCDFLGFMIIL